MLGYLILAGVCSMVIGQLQDSNEVLVDTFAKINDNLVKNASDLDAQRVIFTKLLNFNQKFVETNDEPDKDNLFSYVHTYKEALNKSAESNSSLSDVAAVVKKNLRDFYNVFGDRIAFVSNNCTKISEAECEAKLKVFDSEKEKYCRDYRRKFAKLHYLSLSHINDIAKLVDDYLSHSKYPAGFDVYKYLEEHILKNAYGLVPLSANYQYLKLNYFPCYFNGLLG